MNIKAQTGSRSRFKGRKIPKHFLKVSEVIDWPVDEETVVLENINEGNAKDMNWSMFKSFQELKERETITELIGNILNNLMT